MLTVVECPIFQKLWPLYWNEDERAEFASFIAGLKEIRRALEA